jgi:hypothetical protein
VFPSSSRTTKELLSTLYSTKERGKIEVKGKGLNPELNESLLPKARYNKTLE